MVKGRFKNQIQNFINIILYMLLLSMGIRLGTNPDVLKKLGSIGIVSLAFACMTIIGTIIVNIVFSIKKNKCINCYEETSSSHQTIQINFKEPLTLITIVLVGIFTGYYFQVFLEELPIDTISTYILNFLLFGVGFQMGSEGSDIKSALKNKEAIFLPIKTVIGSLVGGLLLTPFFGLSLGDSLAISAGFGWYSLSGVMLSDLGTPYLGSIALLSNIMRETIAIILIPFLSRTLYPNLSIAIAGATSMDVTLPLISHYGGRDKAPLAIMHGSLLSLAVPILVPSFYIIFN